MERSRRLVVVVPAVAGLILLSALAMRWGEADVLTYDAGRLVSRWAIKGAAPSVESWEAAKDDLLRAEQLARLDAQIPELLGVLHLQRAGQADFSAQAPDFFLRALEHRPASPYTWANVAEARYRLGMTDRLFEQVLAMAYRLGPGEPAIQRLMVDLGLAMWAEFGQDTKAQVRSAIAAGMRRNPLEILQISQRRGKLSLACPHVPGNRRLKDAKWEEICGKLGA